MPPAGDADAVLRLLWALEAGLAGLHRWRALGGEGTSSQGGEGRGGEGRWRRRRSGCGRQREEVAVEEVVAAVEWIWYVGRGEKERVGAPAVE